jgi:molybdopterin converting factor small subunit
MPLRIIIPTALRRLTGDADVVELEAGTVNDVIDRLDERFPGFRSRICDDNGDLRRFINIYVGGEDIRFLDSLATPVPDGADFSIVPAIAGG